MYIDLHCDTLWKFMEDKGQRNLLHNSFSVDIERLRKSNSLLQLFACFVPSAQIEDGYEYGMKMIAIMEDQEKLWKNQFSIVTSMEEVWKNHGLDKQNGMLTVEDGGMLCGRLERLDDLYKKRIRLMTLLWNDENCIGYPNSTDPGIMNKGLKPFGFEVVQRMNELGMIVDVSHLSDGGFWDVIKHSKEPVLASHSNSRNLCNHPRNLTDEMVKALANHGGIIGVNFYHRFIDDALEEGLLDRLTEHIVHMRNQGGIDLIALGTDFDGITGPLEIPDCGQMELLWMALRRKGFSEADIEKIQYKNAARFLNEVLK